MRREAWRREGGGQRNEGRRLTGLGTGELGAGGAELQASPPQAGAWSGGQAGPATHCGVGGYRAGLVQCASETRSWQMCLRWSPAHTPRPCAHDTFARSALHPEVLRIGHGQNTDVTTCTRACRTWVSVQGRMHAHHPSTHAESRAVGGTRMEFGRLRGPIWQPTWWERRKSVHVSR